MIGVFITILTVLLLIDCFLLGLLVMLQRPKQEGLGAAFGGGMINESLGADATNVLQKGTKYLGIGFFVLAILIAMLQARQMKIERGGDASTPDILESIESAAPAPQFNPALPSGLNTDPMLDLTDPADTGVPLTPPTLEEQAAPSATEAPTEVEAPAAETAPEPEETPAQP